VTKMQDDFQKVAAIMIICIMIIGIIGTLASCEKERYKVNAERDKWMISCVDRGGKIAKEVISTNGYQYAYDTCLLEKK
jgi:hypothetical protein